MENTHPFEQDGRIFAHNGVLGDLDEMRRRAGPSRSGSAATRTRSTTSR